MHFDVLMVASVSSEDKRVANKRRCAAEQKVLPSPPKLHAFGVDIGISRNKKQAWLVCVQVGARIRGVAGPST